MRRPAAAFTSEPASASLVADAAEASLRDTLAVCVTADVMHRNVEAATEIAKWRADAA